MTPPRISQPPKPLPPTSSSSPGVLSSASWNHQFPVREVPVVANHYPHRKGSEPRHDHDFMEIQLCANGAGEQQSEVGKTAFRRGDVLLLRPGAWHAGVNNHDVDAYVCCFGAAMMRHELLWTLDEPSLNYLLWRQPVRKNAGIFHIHLDEESLRQCLHHLDALVALGQVETPESRPFRIGHLGIILACLARCVPRKNYDQNDGLLPVHSATKRALALLEENMANHWTLQELARKLNIDISYLGKLFQRTLGLSPMAYLSQIRAEQASRLLLRTPKTISEIAIEVGWPDPNHFARRFRSHYGLSASEYRLRFAQAAKPTEG